MLPRWPGSVYRSQAGVRLESRHIGVELSEGAPLRSPPPAAAGRPSPQSVNGWRGLKCRALAWGIMASISGISLSQWRREMLRTNFWLRPSLEVLASVALFWGTLEIDRAVY